MLSPNDPRYYDPSFDNMGRPIDQSPDEICSVCGEECFGYRNEDYFEVDDAIFCDSCYRDLDWCGDGEHPFTGDPIRIPGIDEFVFCCEEHAQPHKEDAA